MSELFLLILNMSLTASYVIIFIMLIRLLLKKAPKVISYALWGVAAFRLIIPFSFESMFSLMPKNTNARAIPRDIIYQQNPQINSRIGVVDSAVSQILPAPVSGDSVNPLQIYTTIGAYIWVLGITLLLVYSLISILFLKRQLKDAQLIEGNIFEAKNLKTPFVLGLMKPKIYLPVGISNEERNYILLHEQTHINRKDHIIKILAFLLLSIHWFNPLVWVAFILMTTDMEFSCDERVLKQMSEDTKKPYANSLLSLATGRHILNSSPLAFGEGNVKGRIQNVMNYKKPGFWGLVGAVILGLAASIGLASNPMNSTRLAAIEDLSLPFDRVAYGTLISENKYMDFNEAKAGEIADYLRELKIGKSPVSKSRDEERDRINQIHFAFQGFLDNGDIANIYFNFSKDFSEVWVDNGVKPSLSYGVKKPDEVKDFFEQQFGSTTSAKEIDSTEEISDYRASEKDENALTFWIKPDEDGRVMGEVAAIQWLNSYKGDDVSEAERINDYTINDVTVMAVHMAASDDQMVDYIVNINYSIKTASEKYLAPIDNISGKGTFGGLHRELYVKALGKGNFEIINIRKNDSYFDVEGNLDIIMSSPKTSSNPQDYINAHENEYENFFKYGGEEALQYMLNQFEAGNAKGLRGQIMMKICKELLGKRNNVTDDSLSPQEWYNALSVRQEIVLPNYMYDGQDPTLKLVYDTEIEMNSASNERGGFIIVAPKVVESHEEGDMLKVFVTTYSARYKLFGNTLSQEGGSIIPGAITYRKDNRGEYILEEYEQAGDGSYFGPSIKEFCTMPVSGKEIKGLADKILHHYGGYEDLRILLNDNLYQHLKKNNIKDATLSNPLGEIEFSMSDWK